MRLPFTEGEGMDEELTTIQGLLEGADLSPQSRQAALWCLQQLPGLYAEFSRTYDARYADEVLRLARAALQEITGSPVEGAVRVQLVGLHERLGLREYGLGPPRPTARRSPKAR